MKVWEISEEITTVSVGAPDGDDEDKEVAKDEAREQEEAC